MTRARASGRPEAGGQGVFRAGRQLAWRATALLAVLAAASAHSGELPRESRVPGGLAIIDLGTSVEMPGPVTYKAHRAPVLRNGSDWVALIGIPLDAAPGTHVAEITVGGRPTRLEFDVADKQYAEQRLQVKAGNNPVNRYFALLLSRWIGEDFAQSLAQLKALLEPKR